MQTCVTPGILNQYNRIYTFNVLYGEEDMVLLCFRRLNSFGKVKAQ